MDVPVYHHQPDGENPHREIPTQGFRVCTSCNVSRPNSAFQNDKKIMKTCDTCRFRLCPFCNVARTAAAFWADTKRMKSCNVCRQVSSTEGGRLDHEGTRQDGEGEGLINAGDFAMCVSCLQSCPTAVFQKGPRTMKTCDACRQRNNNTAGRKRAATTTFPPNASPAERNMPIPLPSVPRNQLRRPLSEISNFISPEFAALIDLDTKDEDQLGVFHVADLRICTSCNISRPIAAFENCTRYLQTCYACRQRNKPTGRKGLATTTLPQNEAPAVSVAPKAAPPLTQDQLRRPLTKPPTGTHDRLNLHASWGPVASTPQQSWLRRHRRKRESFRLWRENRGRRTRERLGQEPVFNS